MISAAYMETNQEITSLFKGNRAGIQELARFLMPAKAGIYINSCNFHWMSILPLQEHLVNMQMIEGNKHFHPLQSPNDDDFYVHG